MLNNVLTHPLTKGLDVDDLQTTILRYEIIQEKKFLKQIYLEWYYEIISVLPSIKGETLELGSGAGFFKQLFPELITSDIMACPSLCIILNGQYLPFKDRTLSAIVMINVLHHIPNPRLFFSEASRCIQSGGRLIFIEPWVTTWSRLIYQHFHHEPFHPDTSQWDFPYGGPLSGANGAMPWILFERDRKQFELEFPYWEVRSVKPIMPFRYLLAGGVSFRSFMPGLTFPFWRSIENKFTPWMKNWGMFAVICLDRR